MLSRDADYAFYLYTCNRCRACARDGTDRMRPLCAPFAKYGFFSYSGGGKGYVAQGILEGKVKPEEAVEVAMNCLVCGACHHMCPPGFETISFIRDLRETLVRKGHFLNKEHRLMVENLREHSNPWGIRQPAYNNHMKIPAFKPGMDIALYCGCRERSRGGSLHSALKILDKAGLSYGIVPEEKCCGAPMLNLGDYKSFEKTVKSNIEKFNSLGADKILAMCPHCASALNVDYMEIGDLEVEALTLPSLLNELLDEGRIKLNGNGETTVTYHDPCHLGRFLGEYDPPRDVLRKIPEMAIVEMGRSRESALCCGAGGVMYMIAPELSRFAANERVREIVDTGVDTAVTACDYCVSFLGPVAAGKKLRLRHIADVVVEHLE